MPPLCGGGARARVPRATVGSGTGPVHHGHAPRSGHEHARFAPRWQNPPQIRGSRVQCHGRHDVGAAKGGGGPRVAGAAGTPEVGTGRRRGTEVVGVHPRQDHPENVVGEATWACERAPVCDRERGWVRTGTLAAGPPTKLSENNGEHVYRDDTRDRTHGRAQIDHVLWWFWAGTRLKTPFF